MPCQLEGKVPLALPTKEAGTEGSRTGEIRKEERDSNTNEEVGNNIVHVKAGRVCHKQMGLQWSVDNDILLPHFKR